MRRAARRFPLVAALIAVVGVASLSGLARAGASSPVVTSALPASLWAVEIDPGSVARLEVADAARLRAAGVNTLLVDVRRLGTERSTKLIALSRSARLTYLPIVATARASTPAHVVRDACASYRRTTGIRDCAIAAASPRIAALAAKRGGADAVVVRLPGPGALPALRSGGSIHVIGVVTARSPRLTPTWQSAIRHARSTPSGRPGGRSHRKEEGKRSAGLSHDAPSKGRCSEAEAHAGADQTRPTAHPVSPTSSFRLPAPTADAALELRPARRSIGPINSLHQEMSWRSPAARTVAKTSTELRSPVTP